MHIPVITYSQLVEQYLVPNGYVVVDPQPQDFFNGHDRIMVKKGDYSFPLQFREKYFYLQVVILFKQLGIPVPEDHQLCYDQHMALRESKLAQKKNQPKEKNEGGKE